MKERIGTVRVGLKVGRHRRSTISEKKNGCRRKQGKRNTTKELIVFDKEEFG